MTLFKATVCALATADALVCTYKEIKNVIYYSEIRTARMLEALYDIAIVVAVIS